MFGEGSTVNINDSVGTAEKKMGIVFTEVNAIFSLSLHYNGDEIYFHVNKIYGS